MSSTNPFQAGDYDGKPIFHTNVEDCVRAVSGFNRAQCEAGFKVQGLKKTVEAALQRRMRKLAHVATTIRFEDHGQDFLEWDLDDSGKVIGCRPSQGWVWRKRTVVNHGSLRKGVYVILDDMKTVNYPPTDIQRFKGAKA